MTTPFGLIGNTTTAPNVAAPNSVLIAYPSVNFTYTTGTPYIFNLISTIGSNPACSLDTTTGIFTCNFSGTYIIFCDMLFSPLSSNQGVVGSVYVNGSLYQESVGLNTNVQFVAGGSPQMTVTIFSMLYNVVPGTTFTFQLSYTGGTTMPAIGGNNGTASLVDVLYFS